MTCYRTVGLAGVVASLVAMSTGPLIAEGQRGGGTLGGVVVEPVEITLELGQGGRGGRTGGRGTGTLDPATTDPMAGPVVTGAPFSAEATTTVTETLGDGTRIDQRATAKFYRDKTGRVRRELTILGLDTLNTAEPQTVITVDVAPGEASAYALDPIERTARRVARTSGPQLQLMTLVSTLNNQRRTRVGDQADVSTPVTIQGLTVPRRGIPNDLKPTEEQLGTRQIEGVKANGRRTTTVIPTGRIGNDRPIQITDERWESPELQMVVLSRYSDPRTGVVEYRLTNISRVEPRADLFAVPADYTIIEPGGRGGPAPDGGGRRGGGGGGGLGRGARSGGAPQ